MAPMQPKAPGQCRLLGLPAELRNRMYEYALRSDKGVTYSSERCRPHRDLPPAPMALGILRACRQIRDEATPSFYTTNDFRVSPREAHCMLQDIPKSGFVLIAHVTITVRDGFPSSMLKPIDLFMEMERLRRMNIEAERIGSNAIMFWGRLGDKVMLKLEQAVCRLEFLERIEIRAASDPQNAQEVEDMIRPIVQREIASRDGKAVI